MTRVLVDADALCTQSSRSGLGTFVRELLRALAVRGDLDVHAISRRDELVPAGITPVVVRRLARTGRVATYEHEVLRPFTLARFGGAVFHNPLPHAPRVVRKPWVQTLHDVIPLVVNDPSLSVLRRRWKAFGPRYRAATAVVAVSRHAADEGIRVLGLDPARVHVAPNGVSDEFTPATVRDLCAPYLLVVSEYSRRKGFEDACAVIAALAEYGYPHSLKWAGPVPPWWKDEVKSLVRRSARPDLIEVTGYVENLVDLYRGADAVLVTSRYEGFGLPVLEAMASGSPVVSYDNSSLPEVIGDAGLLVPDGDVSSMVEAVRRLLAHETLRAELVGRGLERAAEYTWDRCASVYEQVYMHVASHG